MYRLVLFLMVAAVMISCAGGRMYVNESADIGYYTKVGVIPFSNLTSDRNASEKVTASFVTELLMLNIVELVNTGDFNSIIGRVLTQDVANILDEFSTSDARTIGREAAVEGIFIGAVKDFGMVRTGYEEFPLVAVIVRLIDCETGRVVWSYEVSRKGGPKFPVFSIGETHTLGKMTTKVCREVAASFGKAAG